MESFLARFRHLTVLLLLLMAQLLLLAYQVKTNQEVRLVRIWAVTAVTPLARAVESISTYWRNIFTTLIHQREVLAENERLKGEISTLKLDNQYLQNELATSERAKILLAFPKTIPSRTLAARIIGTGTGANARVVYIDRGSADGLTRNMAVITARGVVGKIASAYPTASLVTLVTQQGFAAGAISQTSRVRGTLRGTGSDQCTLDHVRNPYVLRDGEWLYTSGDDRIFPKGLPVGQVKVNRKSNTEFEFKVVPVALSDVEEVLIVVEGVHGTIPDSPPAPVSGITFLPAPPAEDDGGTERTGETDADRLKEKYRRIGDAQSHTFGASPYRPPDFTKDPGAAKPGSGAAPGVPAPAAKAQGPQDKPTSAPAASPQPAGVLSSPPAQRGTSGGAATSVPDPASPKKDEPASATASGAQLPGQNAPKPSVPPKP